ncbi:hypothetical protein HW555_014061 [Spodoptera exigua]|uniref:Uncharacterized protein n=1 Tax=Spodoptera exigua TaxID=7107 RepID=A0A835G1M7_SPOEX|nr:hypothetical protein HW555_014061 [Spodoptera exigua]
MREFSLAKAVYLKCIVCCRVKGQVVSPHMGNLLQQHLNLGGYQIETEGVDYAGAVFSASRQIQYRVRIGDTTASKMEVMFYTDQDFVGTHKESESSRKRYTLCRMKLALLLISGLRMEWFVERSAKSVPYLQ